MVLRSVPARWASVAAPCRIVQANRGQPGRGRKGSQTVGEEPGVQWVAVTVGEHVFGVVPSAARRVAFLALAAGVFAQYGDGVSVQGDGAHAGRRFRWT